MSLQAAIALSIVPGMKPDAQINGKEGIAIDPDEMASPAQADELVAELKSIAPQFDWRWNEWHPFAGSNQTILYSTDVRILQLEPDDQELGLIYHRWKLNPVGSFAIGNGGEVEWKPTLNKPADNSGPVSDPGALQAKLDEAKKNAQCMQSDITQIKTDVAAIKAKVGA